MRTSACFRGKLNNTHISQFKKKKDTGQDLLKGKIGMEAPCNGLLVVLDTNCSGDSSKIYRNRINNIKKIRNVTRQWYMVSCIAFFNQVQPILRHCLCMSDYIYVLLYIQEAS